MTEIGNGQPLVSVVLPAFQSSGFIGHAIRSVVDQTYTNWELLIVEDPPFDSTDRVVASFADSRISHLRTQTRLGPAGSVDWGIKRANGAFVKLLGSDDALAPNCLAVVVSRAIETGAELVCEAFQMVGDGAPDTVYRVPSDMRRDRTYVRLFENHGILDFPLLKSEALRQVEVNPNLWAAWPYDMWLQMAMKRARFEFVDEVLYFAGFRQGRAGANITRNRRETKQALSRYRLQDIRGLYREMGYCNDEIEEAVVSILIHQEEYDEALVVLEGRLSSKGDTLSFFRRAGLLISTGRARAGLDALLSLPVDIRDNPEIQNNLGVAYRLIGDEAMAHEHFKSALRSFPGYQDASTNLSNSESRRVTLSPVGGTSLDASKQRYVY